MDNKYYLDVDGLKTLINLIKKSIGDIQTTPGEPGSAPDVSDLSFSIGSISSGDSASASITGSFPNFRLNLTLPRGPQGPQGDSIKLEIGTVTSLPYGSDASATLTPAEDGTYQLNLGIPQGAPGDASESVGSISAEEVRGMFAD